MKRSTKLLAGAGLLAVAGAGLGLALVDRLERRAEARRALAEWTAMVGSEELMLDLATRTPGLSRSAMNLGLPDAKARGLFADSVEVRDLAGEPDPSSQTTDTLGNVTHHWPCEDTPRTVELDQLSLWNVAFASLDHFEHTTFKLVRGDFLDSDRSVYETDVAFSAVARTSAGGPVSLHADLTLVWRAQPGTADDARPDWRIASWSTDAFETVERDRTLFVDVLETAVRDREALARVRSSWFHAAWLEFARDEAFLADPFADPARLMSLFGGTSPGLNVVDLNLDGHQDLYVLMDEGGCSFFENQGDGTFEENAAERGLAIEDGGSAVFGDFDNDGDADVFVGRDSERSLYLVNDGGRFTDVSQTAVDGDLPYLVSALSAVDYDLDGLLDVYLSTYGVTPLAYEQRWPELREGPYLLGKYLSEPDAIELAALLDSPEANRIIHNPGPPNVLLHNAGQGRFEVVDGPHPLRVFRNTFHSTWADYDADGDPDVYVANDFAPNNLLRNDGGGLFTDVTEETGTTDVGFGMGVTWGDYDRDGRQDMYVSNMYSKAGRRVIGQFDRIDERLHLMHRGNTLFRNVGPHFDKTSGTKPPAQMVEKAGWSWGSQFVDVDNDGWLDIYALSGFITAPKQLEIPVDL